MTADARYLSHQTRPWTPNTPKMRLRPGSAAAQLIKAKIVGERCYRLLLLRAVRLDTG